MEEVPHLWNSSLIHLRYLHVLRALTPATYKENKTGVHLSHRPGMNMLLSVIITYASALSGTSNKFTSENFE